MVIYAVFMPYAVHITFQIIKNKSLVPLSSIRLPPSNDPGELLLPSWSLLVGYSYLLSSSLLSLFFSTLIITVFIIIAIILIIFIVTSIIIITMVIFIIIIIIINMINIITITTKAITIIIINIITIATITIIYIFTVIIMIVIVIINIITRISSKERETHFQILVSLKEYESEMGTWRPWRHRHFQLEVSRVHTMHFNFMFDTTAEAPIERSYETISFIQRGQPVVQLFRPFLGVFSAGMFLGARNSRPDSFLSEFSPGVAYNKSVELGSELRLNLNSTLSHPDCPRFYTRVGGQCLSVFYVGSVSF